MHCHDADAVANHVVELRCDAGALLRDGNTCLVLPFALELGSPFPRHLALLELAPEQEAGDPYDGEDEIAEEDVAGRSLGIEPHDHDLRPEDHYEACERLSYVAELCKQEGDGKTDSERDSV